MIENEQHICYITGCILYNDFRKVLYANVYLVECEILNNNIFINFMTSKNAKVQF
jgi:hypothetical protein